jgi:hypothetical protein
MLLKPFYLILDKIKKGIININRRQDDFPLVPLYHGTKFAVEGIRSQFSYEVEHLVDK